MIRSLWFKLFVAFTILSILGITMLGMARTTLLNYREFKRVIVPETFSEVIRSQQFLFAEAIKYPERKRWRAMAEQKMKIAILNVTSEDCDFHIGFASNPKMYCEVRRNDGTVFTRHPRVFPQSATEVFTRQRERNPEGRDVATTLGREGDIWVSQAILDDQGQERGRMELLLNAEFNIRTVMARTFEAYRDRDGWRVMVLFFSAVGLLCGLGANWFVTGRLKSMNEAAAIWSEGDFTPRIPVDEKSHDILAEHSRTLNGMAKELESLVELRQHAAVTEERNRVARELHDTVKQNLFALKLQLAAAQRKKDGPEIAAHIEEAQNITREAQQDIMRILTQLAEDPDGNRSVSGRFAALSEDMRRRYGLATVWEKRDGLQLDPGEVQTLLRIVQESMNNAVRHGRATVMTINAFSENGAKCLRISDNGGGLRTGESKTADSVMKVPGEPESCVEHSSGMGLVFMRERAEELPGGQFAITENEQGGATVQITWRGQ